MSKRPFTYFLTAMMWYLLFVNNLIFVASQYEFWVANLIGCVVSILLMVVATDKFHLSMRKKYL